MSSGRGHGTAGGSYLAVFLRGRATPLSRTADYTVQGFLYQFNKTLLTVLASADDDVVTVEGIVEDIEVASPGSVTAIQCKYHEAASGYTLGKIYEPLLQMLVHFHLVDTGETNYLLFAHYPGSTGAISIGKSELEAALGCSLTKYVDKLAGVDLDSFLARFEGEFGPSFDELKIDVCKALEGCGFAHEDIEPLVYPNAIQMIHDLAIKHDVAARSITKAHLLETLRTIKKTAVSRWTLALKSQRQLMDARRKQLKPNLDVNARSRSFFIHASALDDFESDAVTFIRDYIDKYHFKPAHLRTPVFCIECTPAQMQDLQWRLFKNGVISNDGLVAGNFDETRFVREPMTKGGECGAVEREFHIRLLLWNPDDVILNRRKGHDLFILGEGDDSLVDDKDINVEVLAASSLKEIKYMIGLSNGYE